jgi:hypothetical protein
VGIHIVRDRISNTDKQRTHSCCLGHELSGPRPQTVCTAAKSLQQLLAIGAQIRVNKLFGESVDAFKCTLREKQYVELTLNGMRYYLKE